MVGGQSLRRAAFLDRDGVLNVDFGYVAESSRLVWRATAVEAVKWLNARGILVFVVTNQSGVARGLFAEADVLAFHAHMQSELARSGAHIDAFQYCPHHPEGVVDTYRRTCECRKPAAGMIRDLLLAYALDPTACHLFGDKPSDLEAAVAAKVPAKLVKEDDRLLDLVQRQFGNTNDDSRNC
jgi:D-glycero-D-manno-heptose 1,7-bisphosphate phosphatase